MKMFFLACSVMLLAACGSSEVSVGTRTTAEVESVYNVGKVAKGEQVKVKIKVKNTGDSPLVVGEIKAGCSCTSTSKPDEPIKPGKTGYVGATIDTGNFGIGKFKRDVTIVANTYPSPIKVSLEGEIIQ